MANKITCTCGHSWNKSDSSKKDTTVCHVCGKNNMKDGGWLNKYETAENGIEGTMGGLTDQGFNYNGAWGGPSMQFGGNLAGAVGSMYARTGAPSKGPRRNQTDVTDASAQNGMEMKFYQEGLDWTPKNISQDGSKTKKKKTLILAENDPELWNDKYNKGKVNPFITEAAGIKKYVNEYFPDEDVEIVPAYKDSFNEALKRSDANTRLVTLAHAGNNLFGVPVSEYLQSVSKTPYQNCYAGTCYGDDIVEGKFGPTGIDTRNLNNFNVRSGHISWSGFAPVNRGGEEGFKDSFFRRSKNPEIAKLQNEFTSLSKLYDLKSIDEKKFIEKSNELNIKMYNAYKKHTINQEKATDVKTYKFVPYPARTDNDPLRFNPQNILQQKKQGGEITKDGGWLNKYADGGETPQAQLGTHMLTPDFGQVGENIMEMLSVPQKALTKLFSGKYQTPSEAMNIKNPVGAFAVDAVLDPVNLMGAGAVAKASTETGALSKAYKYNPLAFKPNPEAGYRMIGGKEGLLDAVRSGEIRPTSQYEHAHFNIGQPLNPNRLSAEELIQAGNPGGYKGPYMAEMKEGTWQRMTDAFSDNPEMQEQLRLLKKDKDVWQHPLFGNIKVDDPRLKLYKEHWLKGYKEVPKPKKKEKGGEITKDDNGYWNPDNWGEPVEIGSNEITMEGVYEPLLGISDTGDTQMMYPGEDYTFDGESVTEYPVMQKGGSVPTTADSINIYNYAVAQDNYYRKNIEPYSKKTVEPYQQNFNKRVEGVKKGQQSLLNSNLPENQKKWIRENKSPNIQYGLGMGNMDNDYSKELLNKVDTRIKPQNFIRYTVEKPDIDLKDIQSITERNKPQEYMELSNLDRSTSDILLGRNKTIKQKIGDYKGKYDEVVKKLKKTNPNINIEDIVRQSDRFKEAIKQIPGWQTGRIYYDPLAVKPYNMRTPKEREEWEKKYGKPKPKPTQKTTEPQPKVETKKVETKKPEPKPQRETKKDPVVPISKMETPTALNKTVPNLPYRVDYSGNSQYFASDKEGEEFIKNLNKDFMENKISSPGNVSGYYETKKKKNGGWLEKYN